MTTPRKSRAKAPKPDPVQEEPQPAATRRVTLAYTMVVDGHEYAPDSTIELPDRDARELVQAGRARWAAKEEIA